MNGALRRVAVVCALLFGLLLVNANYLQLVRAEALHNDPHNPRLILEEYSRERGPILVADRPVAQSKETQDRLKYRRTYAQGRLYAAATGFYSLVYGATEVEAKANSVLSGTDDSLFVRRIMDMITGTQPRGASVALTLNPAAQRAAAAGLRGKRGAVVALDPSTGAILAMFSSPSYDPNVLSSHDPKSIRAAYQELTADPRKPMLNRAIRQTYPPGSTFKLVTAAAALESGRYQRDTRVDNAARLDLPQTTIDLPNFDNRPCDPEGEADLEDALRRSCNVSFGKIGLELGDDALRKQAEAFGFNQSFAIPMDSARSRFPDELNAPQTAQSAIGQYDVRATPLQMAMVAAAIGNRGVVMRPYLIQEVRAPDLSVLDRTSASELGEAISPQTADTLAEMMVTVVEKGTGGNARIEGVRVGGKTGTAQQGQGRKPHAWFVSLADVDDAKVAVAVVIEDGADAPEVSGNLLAAPVARAVMKAVLRR